MTIDRRQMLIGAGAGLLWQASIARAAAVDADVRDGSIDDVAHVVILMQENRGFDHYFGTMAGVRGFGDRFPPPSAARPGRTIWAQASGVAGEIVPFHLNTTATFALMCAEGTPHTWPDAQAAWDEGRMSRWPEVKTARAMGHYRRDDIPFQFALAEAFTLCDAYHCSVQTGTNTNRLFLWSGTNDPSGTRGGPAIGNSHDSLVKNGGAVEGYRWTSYVERLHAAGIDWRIYEDMADNFGDNPLAGFQRFRDAQDAGPGGPDHDLVARGFSTHTLDRLREDVLAGALPQVSYVVADTAHSEHPAASSPAQGADYTARVLDALIADPKVWSRTVLFVMYDENDGFFDHAPPPAPPSRDDAAPGGLAGGSTVSTVGEYHLVPSVADAASERPELIGRPYGLGPRVPMLVISPWSRGGWVNSEVFDHTSVIRFLERRFGVAEPNISPWRRAVCGDLTSAFDFTRPNARSATVTLPGTAARAAAAAQTAKLDGRPAAAPPVRPEAPFQAAGTRPSRPLGYGLDLSADVLPDRVRLTFGNTGRLGAVFHVYDRVHPERTPRRYTVAAGQALAGEWSLARDQRYDLWVLGPDGFHRRLAGSARSDGLDVALRLDPQRNAVLLTLTNAHRQAGTAVDVHPLAYADALRARLFTLGAGEARSAGWSLAATRGWYDLAVRIPGDPSYLRRFAGRLASGRDGVTDPALGGPAVVAL